MLMTSNLNHPSIPEAWLPIVEEKLNMGFINERIPEEEKKKFTFPVMTSPSGRQPTLNKWTIDREREAFLVLANAGGGGIKVLQG